MAEVKHRHEETGEAGKYTHELWRRMYYSSRVYLGLESNPKSCDVMVTVTVTYSDPFGRVTG